ncbi:MAG: PKD domain-containing protein [Chitinophagales bacterium]|nr:PKD domain-containing protein [Chitinophagales bacterium]
MKKLLFVLSIITIGFSACKKAQDIVASPHASFSTNLPDDYRPLENDQIKLTNTSSENTTYFWDFGNGITSTEKSPSISYKMHGSYTIKLVVTNSNGIRSSTTKNLIILCSFVGGTHKASQVL